MDVTDCRDLTSLQALIHMIMFLQCSAKLSTCYSFIGVALRSALRMGLHRSFSDSFNPIEAEMRRRCFWIIRKMDIFVVRNSDLHYHAIHGRRWNLREKSA